MGQGASSTSSSSSGPADAHVDASGTPLATSKLKGLAAWKKRTSKGSRSSAESRSSCSSVTDARGNQKSGEGRMTVSSSGETLSSSYGQQSPDSTPHHAGRTVPTPAQQQQQHLLPPRPPTQTLTSTNSFAGSSDSSSNSMFRQQRRSGSYELHLQQPQQPQQQQQQQMPPRPRSCGSRPSSSNRPAAAAGAGAARGSAGNASCPSRLAELAAGQRAASLGSVGSHGSGKPNARASFSMDAHHEDHEQMPPLPHGGLASSLYAPSGAAAAAAGKPGVDGHGLSQQDLQQHNQQQGRPSGSNSGSSSKQQGYAHRASVDSCASRASSTRSVPKSSRSSFAAEALPDDAEVAELDHYGRPSFAAFEPLEKATAGRGAVFEASLPPDLADMYRRLAVLLPQGPIPLVTVLQLWGVTDPQEAQETVQIFVMQGVLKIATLPDGATWLMVSPDHQQYILADHPESVREWHQAVLDIYKRQVIASRYLQLQQQGLIGSSLQGLDLADVSPSQFVNDGYIWLALTHHLLGAGQLNQVRGLLTDPGWLEVKLHCYGVAAVVDDFRSYLQVGNDLAVKAVLQAFQMSLSCCMERSHIPMMRHQLVLRLMAAAQAAAKAAAAAAAAAVGARAESGFGHDSGAAAVTRTLSVGSATSGESGAGSAAAAAQQQYLQYQQEMWEWFSKQYAKCRLSASLLQASSQPQQPQQGQQQQLPPHLMSYTPSLMQAGGMQRMALRGHLGPVRRVVITPDGKDVLTASDDGSVQVWDMDIGDCVMQLHLPEQPPATSPVSPPGALQGPAAPLTALAVTADGACCLCGDVNGWLSCWNLKTGQLVQRVRAHRGRLNALVLDTSGSRCITGGQDRTAKLWSLPAATPGIGPGGIGGSSSATGGLVGSMQLEFEMTGHGLEHPDTGAVLDVAISNDGVLGATVSDDMKVKVWDLEQQQCVQTCRGHTGWVVSVQFVGNTHNLVSASHDETARAWDGWTGESLGVMVGHDGRLNAVRSSSDGRTVVTCSDDMTARVWETFDYTCIGVLRGHTSWINDVALLRGSNQAVTISGDGTARLWDIPSSKCLQVLTGHSDDVTCVVLTSRGRFVVTGSVDGTAQVWDLAAQDVSSIDVHNGKVISVVCCQDGSHAASIGADGHLRLWDLANGACLANQAGHVKSVPQSLLLAEDCTRAFSGGGDRKLVAWDMKTGSPSICLPAKQGSRSKCIHVSADGSTAVVLLFDSSMSVYDTATGEVKCDLMRRGERDAQRVHSGGVNAVYLTANGGKAVSVSKDNTARVWDTASGMCVLVLQGHEDSVHAAVISPDESLVATASFDCTVRLWDFTTGDCLKVLQHTDPVMRVAFSPAIAPTHPAAAAAGPLAASSSDARTASATWGSYEGGSAAAAAAGMSGVSSGRGGSSRLVTGCDGRALWLWDVDSGACVAALGEHKEAVTAVAFSPDGTWLASTSQDRSVLVWEAASGKLAGLYVGDVAMMCCCFAVRGPGGGGAGPAQGSRQQLQHQEPAGEQVAAEQPGASEPQTDGAAVSIGAGGDSNNAPAAAAGNSGCGAASDEIGGGGGGGEAGSQGVDEAKTAAAVDVKVAQPLPGGLTLVVGDARGQVHFIDCL